MIIDIVGEDDVTRAVIKRLIKEIRKDITIGKVLPARGGQIKILAPKYNLLQTRVMLLTDLDTYDCPTALIKDWFGNAILNPNYLFRIAYGETESWLMADRKGFSNWIDADINLIPLPSTIDKRKNILEIVFPYKPSLYLMREIAPCSKNNIIKEGLMPKEGANKGPLYNSILTSFIEHNWNTKDASNNSTSLTKAIGRLQNF